MTPDQLRELATELRYMADVYRDWDGEKVCRAADHLLACADNQPYETERWNVERQSDGSLLVCFNRHERGEKCEYEHFVPAPAAPQPCWCHKCNEGRLVNGVPFAMTQMIVCPICGNKRCPHASDHALACTASNDPIAAPVAPQADQWERRPQPVDEGQVDTTATEQRGSARTGNPTRPCDPGVPTHSQAEPCVGNDPPSRGHAFTITEGKPTTGNALVLLLRQSAKGEF